MKNYYELKIDDKRYPKKLLNISKPPKVLYVLGNIELLNNKSIAIVGTRSYTEYGKHYASKFSNNISKAGLTIVSGLARGIDTFSHENSMNNIGKTIAVIASGFDHIYPEENQELANKILEYDGAIISEYPPNTKVDMQKFPIRNRIIAGLSDATLVVEALSRSGSEITARNAMEQGKTVFCIPQDIGKKTGVGTNNLIKKGAKLVTSPSEILEEFGEFKIVEQEEDNIKFVHSKYKKIYDYISKKSSNIDEISRELNISISELNTKLTFMEIDGLVEILPGNKVKIKD